VIDLHVHSSASDGTQSPTEVVAAAAAAGLSTIALTDHDTTAGWAEADRAGRSSGVEVVFGAELSCRAEGMSVHLLSYLHDPENPDLIAQCELVRADRATRGRRMVDLLAADLPLRWADVERVAGPGATIGRPHLADALVDLGLVTSRDEAFATLLHPRSRYYLDHHAPEAVQTVRLVRAAGGVPVMAHPLARRRGRTVGDQTVAELAEAGLLGIEVYHRDHDDADRDHLLALADRLGLLVTGASDYHGVGKPNVIGENTTSPDVLAAIRELSRAVRTPREVPR
jgi:predicted metal-dependent phosphoesterase TrpH